MTDSGQGSMIPFFIPPRKIPEDEVPSGLVQCDDDDAISCARFALAHLAESDAGFPEQFFPKASLFRCALLGSYATHEENFLYDENVSLRKIIEEKINCTHSKKYIIPVLTNDIYYCFELDIFNYAVLDELKEKTFSVDIVLILPKSGGGYIFFADSPACYVFFESLREFEQGFVRLSDAKTIFANHMIDWKDYESDAADTWLKQVCSALHSDDCASDE